MNRFFRGWRGVAAMAGLAFVLLAAFAVVLSGYSILQSQSRSSWARQYARVLPLPAARVNGQSLLYRDVLTRWDTIDTFAARQTALGASVGSPVEMRAQAYEQAIRELFVQTQAQREGFVLQDEAVQQNLDRLVAMSGTSTDPGEIGKFLQANFGWSLEDYRDRVVRPATLEEALATRAAVGGQTAEDWRAQLEKDLRSAKVKRYLQFPS